MGDAGKRAWRYRVPSPRQLANKDWRKATPTPTIERLRMTATDRPAGADQPTHGQPTAGHMERPSPSHLDVEATDCAEGLAREEALRRSTIRAPR